MQPAELAPVNLLLPSPFKGNPLSVEKRNLEIRVIAGSWKFTGDKRPAGGCPFFFLNISTQIQNNKQVTLAGGENK